MKTAILFSLLCFSWASVHAQAALENTPISDYDVRHITTGGGKVFLTGEFNWFGQLYNSSMAVFDNSLTLEEGYPDVPLVQIAISDDAGGWYTASYATISHIKPDKTIETLPLEFDGGGYPLVAMRKIGNMLYVGGQFTSVSGVARNYVAAIDLTTQTLTAWNPGANGYVYSMEAVGSTVYVGGSFSSIGGQTRSKIAAIDATTGLATSWNANVATGTGYVFTIAANATMVYFGGSFSNVGSGSPSRRNFAAVTAATGALTSFNPRPDDDVQVMLLDGNTLYVSGDFGVISSASKQYFAAFDLITGTLTGFDIEFNTLYNNNIYALAMDGQNLFIAGDFLKVNGEERSTLAVADKTTGELQPVDEGRAISSYVLTLAVSGGKVLAGGYLRGIEGISTSIHCVAIDESTGALDKSWNPQVLNFPQDDRYQNELWLHYQDDLIYYNQEIYFPGDGFYGTKIGSLNPVTGAAEGWTAEIDGEVLAWAFSENTLFISGEFDEVEGESVDNFAAIDLATGNILAYTLSEIAGESIYSMGIHNDILYISGKDGELIALNAATGDLAEWSITEDLSAFGLLKIATFTDDHIYISGNGVFRLDLETALLDETWLPLAGDNGEVNAVVVAGNSVFIAGGFSPGLIRADITSGEITGQQPDLIDVYENEGSVDALAVSGSKLYAGGGFNFVDAGGVGKSHYAVYPLSTNSAPEIEEVFRAIPIQGIMEISLSDIISDVDDNIDWTTAEVATPPASGAPAIIDNDFLIIDYSQTSFSGNDKLTLRVCDTENACAEQEITIELSGDIVVYNAVSANGDEKNDRLRIQNIETFTNNKVSIFNRWGDMVFEVTDYNNEDRVFTGFNKNNKELPTGTYYYKIEYADKTKTGYLSLKR